MFEPAKTPWPDTYLARLHAVTTELQKIGAPVSIESLVERFEGVTAEQVEAIVTALVLFGRVEKKGDLFQAAPAR